MNKSLISEDVVVFKNKLVLAGVVIFSIGLLALIGWTFGIRPLASVFPDFVPMAPGSAISFILLGSILFSDVYRQNLIIVKIALTVVVLIVIGYGLFKFIEYIFQISYTLDIISFPFTEKSNNFPIRYMSPISGLLFSLCGSCLLIILNRREEQSRIVNGIGVIVAFLGSIVILGYSYGTPFFYNDVNYLMTLNTAIAFCFLGIGLATVGDQKSLYAYLFKGSSINSRLIRGILPAIFLAIFIQGLIDARFQKFFPNLNPALVTAIVSLTFIFLTGSIVYAFAKSIFSRAREAERLTRQALESLRKSEERFRSLFEKMFNGFAYCQMIFKDGEPDDFIYIEVNQAFEDLTGLKNVVGKRVTEVIPGIRQSDADLFDVYGRVASTGNPEKLEFYLEALKDWYSISVYSPQRGYFVAIFDVITERKQAEEKINELNIDLERRVIERTTQLEIANKEMEAFSYSVSHDLRSPLRTLIGFSQALMEDYQENLDDTAKDYLNRIIQGGKNMSQLIDDLLKLARVVRSEMIIEKVNLSILAREIADELQTSSLERQVKWIIYPDLSIMADPSLMKIVLTNLLGNAWKFSAKKKDATIQFWGEHKDAITLFYVRDNGAGFDMNYAHKLFGAFQRLHDVSEFEGNGIGLAIVQRIITRHGGLVWAEGKVDQGATIFFTLPNDR